MSKAKVSELLEALNRCLPLTAEDDKGCIGCPYGDSCSEIVDAQVDDSSISLPVELSIRLVEDLRDLLKDLNKKEAAHGQD